MLRDHLYHVALTGMVATMLLTGSAGAAQSGRPISPQVRGVSHAPASIQRPARGWMKLPDATSGLAYISDFLTNSVTVFSMAGAVQGQITGLSNPGGLFVDGKHNLWVANNGANNVLVFARGALMPSTTLNDPGAGPLDVTICPHGTVYVAGSNSTSIEVYPKGSTNPTRSLSFAGVQQNDALTCDAAGNVFVTVVVSFHGGVVEFPGGKQSGATQLPISLSGPGGIKVNTAGNLLVDDQSPATITEYTETGTPTGNAIQTASDCIKFDVTRNNKVVGCAVYASSGTSEGQSYAFPGGKMRQTYSSSFMLPYGFAFDPGQKGI